MCLNVARSKSQNHLSLRAETRHQRLVFNAGWDEVACLAWPLSPSQKQHCQYFLSTSVL